MESLLTGKKLDNGNREKVRPKIVDILTRSTESGQARQSRIDDMQLLGSRLTSAKPKTASDQFKRLPLSKHQVSPDQSLSVRNFTPKP
jgi:hypothetical protein